MITTEHTDHYHCTKCGACTESLESCNICPLPFVVIDRITGKVVYRTTWRNRTRARRWADRKDLEYGAVRYLPGLDVVR